MVAFERTERGREGSTEQVCGGNLFRRCPVLGAPRRRPGGGAGLQGGKYASGRLTITLGRGVTAARQVLALLVEVRILAPQLHELRFGLSAREPKDPTRRAAPPVPRRDSSRTGPASVQPRCVGRLGRPLFSCDVDTPTAAVPYGRCRRVREELETARRYSAQTFPLSTTSLRPPVAHLPDRGDRGRPIPPPLGPDRR